LPDTFDANGIAVAFASDGIKLRTEATRLSESLVNGRIADWLVAPSPFHIKLYSVSFALLSRWFGATILSAEPLNVLCYLAILVLVFNLGQEVFERRAGLIAAATVALWPSLLLHTTQLLKDPLFLVGMLAFIHVNMRLLSRTLSWPQALATGASGSLMAALVWLARDNFGELLIATMILGAVLLTLGQVRAPRLPAANLVGMALLIVVTVGVTRAVPEFRRATAPPPAPLAALAAPSASPWSRLAVRVATVRHRFVTDYAGVSSNIDGDVPLGSAADLVRYLPRAAAIGFFAPFPDMWLTAGSTVGSAGRLVSGLETLTMYVVEGFAVVGLWRGGRTRRRLSVWFLGLVAAMGMTSLGLVVLNIGALYRLRYAFVILLIVLASPGAALADERAARQ
jgi:hypothetical protein